MALRIPAVPPFDLTAVVKSHGWVQLPPFEWDDDNRELRTVTEIGADDEDRRVVGLRVEQLTDSDGRPVPKVRVVCEGIDEDMLGEAAREEIREQVTWMLGLDQDLAPFYRFARGEPALAHVEAQAQGRILHSPTLFEDTVKTILTTNTAWSGTIRMTRALVEALGDPLPDAPTRRAFPHPEAIAATTDAELRELGLGYRAPYVGTLAREVAAGKRDLKALKQSDLPTDEARRRLLDIKGIGAYAAASLLMLLGHYEDLPIDSWARKMVSERWHAGEPVGEAEVKAAFRQFGRWKGLAYWFWDWSA